MNFFTGQKTIDIAQPTVELKRRLKKVCISGVSRMADPSEFYLSVTADLTNYFEEFKHTLILEFQLEYINTGSAKWIYSMLNQLQNLSNSNGMVQVVWYYERDDETIEESGQDLKENLKIPFELKQLN